MPPLNKEDLQSFLSKKFPDSEIRFIGEGWSSVAFQADDKIKKMEWPVARLRALVEFND